MTLAGMLWYSAIVDLSSPAGEANSDQARARLRVAAHLHEIEGNPLDAADLAMFAMFEAKAWSFEQRRAYIAAQARATVAAE